MSYAQLSLLWAVLGFMVGFSVGYGWHVFHAWRHGVAFHMSRAAVGVLIACLAVAMTLQSYLYQRDRAAIVTCQAEYNFAVAENLKRRAEWAAEDREALHALIRSVFENDADPAQLRAYRNWTQVTRSNDQSRVRHPLPPLPEGRCGL